MPTLVTLDTLARYLDRDEWRYDMDPEGSCIRTGFRGDHATYRARAEASPDLQLEPSEYFHRQFFVTFEDDELGLRQRDVTGVGNMLWGNDYPHHDAIWPHSTL